MDELMQVAELLDALGVPPEARVIQRPIRRMRSLRSAGDVTGSNAWR